MKTNSTCYPRTVGVTICKNSEEYQSAILGVWSVLDQLEGSKHLFRGARAAQLSCFDVNLEPVSEFSSKIVHLIQDSPHLWSSVSYMSAQVCRTELKITRKSG